jgi:hypothetical protein
VFELALRPSALSRRLHNSETGESSGRKPLGTKPESVVHEIMRRQELMWYITLQ